MVRFLHGDYVKSTKLIAVGYITGKINQTIFAPLTEVKSDLRNTGTHTILFANCFTAHVE